jgi:hypothetical protein
MSSDPKILSAEWAAAKIAMNPDGSLEARQAAVEITAEMMKNLVKRPPKFFTDRVRS